MKIIAADDEPGVLALIDSIISKIDDIQLVGMAENATQAIRLVSEQKPDLALLDIELPDKRTMGGFFLTWKARLGSVVTVCKH